MKLPSRKECFALLKKYSVPSNIIEHSIRVKDVAIFLGKKLLEKGEKIDLQLLEDAALLHDIDKKICLDDKTKRHARVAAEILKKEGFPKIAEIVAQHRLNHILEKPFSGWEAKLVYYADKRVRHIEIVSLDERFDYLLQRYGSMSADIKKTILECKPKVLALEQEIFSRINASKELGELDEGS